MMYYLYTIPLPPVGKKNSQQILTNPKTKRPFIAQSARYKKYAKDCAMLLRSQKCPSKAITYPVHIDVRFYMPSRRRVDTVNLQESLWDILVDAQILEDDNRDIIASANAMTFYDKDNPRTEVVIQPYEEEYEQWRKIDECE